MKLEEKIQNESESLRIISEMIQSAKSEVRSDGFLYLMWGWLSFIAALTQFTLIMFHVPKSWMPWMVLMPLGTILMIVYFIKRKKREKVKTRIGDFFGYVWKAFSAALFLVIFFMHDLGVENMYPLIVILYGIGTYISGGLLNFKPLIRGGIACWIIAGVSFFLMPHYRILLLALALLVAYIIPGHLLKSAREK